MSFALAASVVLSALIASQAVKIWLPTSSWLEHVAWGWLVVQASLGLSAFILWWCDWVLGWAMLGLLGVCLVLLFVRPLESVQRPRQRAVRVTHDQVSGRVSGLVLGLVLAPVIGCTLISAVSSSGLGWDGLGIWGLKGKLLAAGALDWETLKHPLSRPSHPEYPLHLPLVAAVFAQVSGGWNGRILPLLAACDLTALWLLLGSLCGSHVGCRRELDRPPTARSWTALGWCAAALLAIAGTPLLWRELPEGKADVSLGVFVAAALIALDAWRRSGLSAHLVLAAVAGGLAAATKQEGMVYLLLLAAITLALGWRVRRFDRGALAALTIAGALALPWPLARMVAAIETEPFRLGSHMWGRLPMIAERMIGEMLRLDHWGVLWPLAWAAVLVSLGAAICRRRSTRTMESLVEPSVEPRVIELSAAALLLGGWLLVVIAYATTPHDLAWHLDTSLDRLLLQLVPTAGLLIYAVGARWLSAPLTRW